LGGEGKRQGWMEIKDQEGQGPLWVIVPLLMKIFPLLSNRIVQLFHSHSFQFIAFHPDEV
jgi:hypothetical protein